MLGALGLAVAPVVLTACSSGPSPTHRHRAAKKPAHTTTTTTTNATVAPGSAAPCTGANLSASQVEYGGGKGGSADTIVQVTNKARSACSLTGYPQLQLMSSDGHDLPTTVQQGGTGIPAKLTVQTVNLAGSGGQASFMGYWIAVPSASAPSCPFAPKAQLLVPGSSKPIAMVAQIGACSGVIQVSPFQPGVISLP